MHLLISNLSRTGGYSVLLLALLALGMPAASADITVYINEELMGEHNENTVTVESGREIKIWIDLTDSHKENVSRLVVVGEYLDTARDLITGVASYDAPDDNEIPPDYKRYYVKWPGKGTNGYARDGAYIGMLQVTVKAQHDNGSLLGEQTMFVIVKAAEEDGVSLSLPDLAGIIEKLPYAVGGLLLVLVLGFGVKRLLDPEELVPQKREEYDPLKESMMGTGHKVELPSTEDDDDDEYEDDDDIDDSIGADVPEEGLSETELLAQLTSGAELADSSKEDAEDGTGDDAAPPAAAAAPVRRKVKKKPVRKAKRSGRKVKRKATAPAAGKPPKPSGKPPAPKGAGYHCPKDGSALQHWPDSGYATDYYCQKCEEYVAPAEQHAGDRQVTCPNCDRKHAIPPETIKFICQCGRRIRLG